MVDNSRVPKNTVIGTERFVSLHNGKAQCSIGLPLDGELRPYLSNHEPKEEDKIRVDLKLQTATNDLGEKCLLFSVESKKAVDLRLPISFAVAVGQPLTASTVSGEDHGLYKGFEGAVNVTDGAFFLAAVGHGGEKEIVDINANRVARDFTNKLLEIAGIKLGQLH